MLRMIINDAKSDRHIQRVWGLSGGDAEINCPIGSEVARYKGDASHLGKVQNILVIIWRPRTP